MKEQVQRSQGRITKFSVLRRVLGLGGVIILFGLTWLFAALTINIAGSHAVRIIFQVLFVITATFQGFLIFFFFCLLNKEARESWINLFRSKNCMSQKKILMKTSEVTPQTSMTGKPSNLSEKVHSSDDPQNSILVAENDTMLEKNRTMKEETFTKVQLSEMSKDRGDGSVTT